MIQYQLVKEKDNQQDCYSLTFNHDATILFQANRHNIHLYQDIQQGQFTPITTIKAHERFVTCLCPSKKRNWFISGGFDGQIVIWEGEWIRFQTIEEVHPQYGRDQIFSIVLSEDENEFYTSSFNGIIKIWVFQKEWVCKQILNYHKKGIKFLSLSPNGKFLASASEESFRIWEKKEEWSQKQLFQHIYLRVCFISDDELIATQCVPGNLCVFKLKQENFEQVQKLFLHEGSDETFGFPIIYNKIILVRHSEKVYIIDREEPGTYLIKQIINGDYRAGCLYGQILVMARYEVKMQKNKKPSKFPQVTLQIWNI